MKLFYKIGLVFLSVAYSFSVSAQRPLADSIKKLLGTDLPDSLKAYNMVMYAMYMEPLNLDSAHMIYDEAVAFSLAKKLNYYAGFALRYQATPYQIAGEKKKQLQNLERSVELLQKAVHSNAGRELGLAYVDIAMYYRGELDFNKAVEYSLKGIDILEQTNNQKSLVTSCINLAIIYQQMKLTDQQKIYIEKALSYARKLGDKKLLFIALLQYGMYCTELKDFKKTKTYFDSAQFYYSSVYPFSYRQSYFLIGASSFQNLKQYDSARYYYQKAFELAKEFNSRWNMSEPLLQIGYVYLQEKKYAEAENYLKQGLDIALKDSAKVFIKEGYGTLSDLYFAMGRYKESVEYLQQYNEIRDTILNEERKKFALELETKYETEKKDNLILLQTVQLEKKSLVNYLLIGGAIALLLIIALLYRNYRHKQKLQEQRIAELETEKQLSATEAVLKGEEQERTRLAKDLHDGLGGMLSGIKHSFNNMKGNLVMTPENAQAFERSMDMLDSSIKEMRRVAHNMMPETLVKYGLDIALKDFCQDMNLAGSVKVIYQSVGIENAVIDQTTSITIYRIVQELVNNILKHASAKQAVVQINKLNDQISITVEDDGNGFDTSILRQSKGMGWSNILNRVEFMKGVMDVQSGPGNGTSVHIELKA